MPQMAPMSWLILFTVFCMTLMVVSSINYYLYTPLIEKTTQEMKTTKKMNWKW
uniref:ATP synthase complex subunit 8 n=1 Tax=Euphaea formosa TaxID=476664 RepID=E0YN07_9ODON|nr:ATP synthase F0 subunit 8 [Euphaea formosa]ADM33810.1 ATP synthase F0 subunit 8 [Euphaea formosa]